MGSKSFKTTATLAMMAVVGSAGSATTASAATTIFGSDNDGLGGFTHTAINDTTTFLTEQAGSVQYRNQNTGTLDAGFIKQFSIDRTPDSGQVYTMTGTFTLSDGYADDNNRLGLVLFTDPTTVASRSNTGQIGIVWNTDDDSRNDGPTGDNTNDNFGIYNDFEGAALADASVDKVLRNQTIEFAQDLYQGTQVTMSASFWFTGTDIKIEASMTDAGGVTNVGTATVLASEFTSDYFGFVSAYRARNYDGDPDPTGAARDNPLIQDYESFSLTVDSVAVVPAPLTSSAVAGLLGLLTLRRRRGVA